MQVESPFTDRVGIFIPGDGSPRTSSRAKHPFFKWVKTGLGNLKSAITGTCRSFDAQHADRYLAAYEWRFNRRFDLDRNIERLARVAVASPPSLYRSIALVKLSAEMLG